MRFNTKNRYLTNSETKKLAEYFAQEPVAGMVYTKSDANSADYHKAKHYS